MLTNCLAACAHLTITVSEIERDIGRKSSFFHTSLAFDAPVRRGSRRNSATPFGTDKLEWLGYHMVKKNSKISLFVLAQLTNVTDRRTPRAGNSRAMHSIARQKQTDKKHHPFSSTAGARPRIPTILRMVIEEVRPIFAPP